MKQIEIAAIVFDASTQARAAIDESVVADYAEKMLNGEQFPEVVVFHDGNHYYMGDGFHRGLAAQRNGSVTIRSDVRAGTREDALWFALGANKKHGRQMTVADKKHAILMALQTWPDRSMTTISEQIGCAVSYVKTVKDQVFTTEHLPARVTGKDGKSYPATQSSRTPSPQYVAVEALVREGLGTGEIRKATGAAHGTIAKARKALGVAGLDRSPQAVAGRLEQMRTMAGDGYTSRQIAVAVGMNEDACRDKLRAAGIVVTADKVTRNLQRHDSTRIVENMVMDAENLTADVNLIEFATLPSDRLGEWIDSLITSKKALDSFIKRLIKEQQKHGEAA